MDAAFQYTVVTTSGGGSEALVAKVSEKIVEGWRPMGAVAFHRDEDGYETWAQAMIRGTM